MDPEDDGGPGPVRWTPRERDVLDLIADGRTNAEIADRLGISFATAKWHVSEILSKLGMESREEVARFWRRERTSFARVKRTVHWVFASLAVKAATGAIAVTATAAVVAGLIARGGSSPETNPPPSEVPVSATAAASEWDALRRPLNLPSISPGEACPASKVRSHTAELGAGAGDGPFFVTMAPIGAEAVMEYGNGSVYLGEWGGQKTLWYVAPTAYQGRALVRGRRIDGAGEVRFTYITGQDLEAEMQLDVRAAVAQPFSSWPSWVTATRIRIDSPGCYAFQVDGIDFTEVIVFQAVRGNF